MDTQSLFKRIMFARDRVYQLAQPTPTQWVTTPAGTKVCLKREDRSPIHSYKWRGSYNKIAIVQQESPGTPIVAASAGNHAQGVAIAAAKLGCKAAIFMPSATPEVKVQAARNFGGDYVDIILDGDTFDDAYALARNYVKETGAVLIAPFDDPDVIAGQGTIGDEIVTAAVRPTSVYLEIGGGGMAAGVACVLRQFYPDIEIIGVEQEHQASMKAAVEAGSPVTLPELDTFCDGTAVRRTGEVTFPLCRDLIDRFMTVTNTEVSSAVQTLWNIARVIPEPSGALGMAGLLRDEMDGRLSSRPMTVISGSNVDFPMLSLISRRARIGAPSHRYYEFELSEEPQQLVGVLDAIEPKLSIIDFQYGKVADNVGYPIIGFEGTPDQLAHLAKSVERLSTPARTVTGSDRVEFRVIPLDLGILKMPVFLSIDFPERAGAMVEFMKNTGKNANICYFNYQNTGEIEGHTLIGFEFDDEQRRNEFLAKLRESSMTHRLLTAEELGLKR